MFDPFWEVLWSFSCVCTCMHVYLSVHFSCVLWFFLICMIIVGWVLFFSPLIFVWGSLHFVGIYVCLLFGGLIHTSCRNLFGFYVFYFSVCMLIWFDICSIFSYRYIHVFFLFGLCCNFIFLNPIYWAWLTWRIIGRDVF